MKWLNEQFEMWYFVKPNVILYKNKNDFEHCNSDQVNKETNKKKLKISVIGGMNQGNPKNKLNNEDISFFWLWMFFN